LKRQIILRVLREKKISIDECAKSIGITSDILENYFEGKIDLEIMASVKLSRLVDIAHDILK
jgi:hypothetical protein